MIFRNQTDTAVPRRPIRKTSPIDIASLKHGDVSALPLSADGADTERQLSTLYHKIKTALAMVASLDWEPELLYSTEVAEILQFCVRLADIIEQQRTKIGPLKIENTKPYLKYLRSL